MLHVQRFVVSPIRSNCYVLSESLDKGAKAVIVDPGDTAIDDVLNYIDAHEFDVVANWNTHAHFDHVLGVDVIRNKYHCLSYLHPDDQIVWDETVKSAKQWTGRTVEPLAKPDKYYRDQDVVKLGDEEFTVWHTPGHSPGGVCLVGRHVVISGDTLFKGTVGRTDINHASQEQMDESLIRVLDWSDDLVVYPGHGSETIVGEEKATNRFLRIAARGGV